MNFIFLTQDPHKLVNFVCGSNYKVDGEDVKIKPDSEYPVSENSKSLAGIFPNLL